MKCKAKYCNNESRSGVHNVSFFRFPRNNKECDEWKRFCGLPADFTPTGQHRICSLHFREEDIYMDVHGKLHRMSKSVPVFETVAQVGETTRRSKLSLSYESDAENTPPNTLPSQNVCEPSEKPQEYMEYEFLDEAFVHPEGLGFGSSVNCASNANETHSSCANCVTSAQKREKDRRLIKRVQNANAALKRKLESFENNPETEKIRKELGDDQYKLITSGLIRIGKWSNESIMEGLRTRFACGSKAYEIERRKRRLPSSRTLCERLQSLRFDSGCLDEIFDILSLKIKQLPDDDKDCVLLFDEMAIQSGTDYCPNLKKFVGNVTLPEHTGIANHALVFMLAGVKTHWKQVIGYHFTGDSINNGCLKDIIFELIRKAEGIGFRVHAVVCDCGVLVC